MEQLSSTLKYLLSSTGASLEKAKECIIQLDIKPDYPIILIGGTNGKGSVCAYLTTILSLAGYKVGGFTSPHVLNYNERITINNQAIDNDSLNKALGRVINVANSLPIPTNLGLFKAFALAAHLIFTQQQVDITVIEVGIGGKYDVTNLFEPTISAITTVDFDHCNILGNTLEEIALEKAGIYRPNIFAFYGSLNPPQSLINYAHQIGAKLQCFGTNFGLVLQELSFNVWVEGEKFYTIPYPSIRGNIQPQNAALALAILTKLAHSFPVSTGCIKTGLLKTFLIGRFQVLPGLPQIVLDVAHNQQAVTIMLQNMLKLPFAKHNYVVFGIANDKDVANIIRLCINNFDKWYIAKINKPNGLNTTDISHILQYNGVQPSNIIECETISLAYTKAFKNLTNEDRILGFGSFLVVEEIYKTIEGTRI